MRKKTPAPTAAASASAESTATAGLPPADGGAPLPPADGAAPLPPADGAAPLPPAKGAAPLHHAAEAPRPGAAYLQHEVSRNNYTCRVANPEKKKLGMPLSKAFKYKKDSSNKASVLKAARNLCNEHNRKYGHPLLEPQAE